MQNLGQVRGLAKKNFRESLGEQFRGGLSLHEFAGLVEVIVNDGLGVDTEGMID